MSAGEQPLATRNREVRPPVQWSVLRITTYGAEPIPDPEEVVPHHEWVITHDQYASGRKGLSSFVPGVEYDELNFGSEVE